MKIDTIIRKDQAELKKFTASQLKKCGYNPVVRDGFIYAKGTHPILLVAHLDTVHKEVPKIVCWSSDGNYIMSPQGIGGDDRCGVYMILEIIKSKQCHVLFCEDEEVGGIGAEKFVESGINPKVKFIVELDRRGSNDAVFYDCDNRDFIDFVCGYGFNEEFGSFSDISIIAPHLKTAAVNISSGYYNAHTQHEYISMNVVRQNINKVKRLIDNPTEHYEYIEATYSKYKFDTYPGWISDKYGDAKHVYSGWYDSYGTFTKEEYRPMRVEQLMYVDNDILVLDGGEPVDADYIMMDARGNLYEYDEYDGCAYMNPDARIATGYHVEFNEDEASYVEVW